MTFKEKAWEKVQRVRNKKRTQKHYITVFLTKYLRKSTSSRKYLSRLTVSEGTMPGQLAILVRLSILVAGVGDRKGYSTSQSRKAKEERKTKARKRMDPSKAPLGHLLYPRSPFHIVAHSSIYALARRLIH